MAWNFDEYLDERVDELFADKAQQDFVQDQMIHHWVDYRMAALDTTEKLQDAMDECVRKTKIDLCDHFIDMIEREWDELQAEYRADMMVDRQKDFD